MQQFKMPQLGETVLEATVTRWLKSPGDAVEVDEPIVEVSTDKVDSEIPSPVAGELAKILVQEGETIPVGAVMAEITGGGADDGDADSAASSASSSAPPPAPKRPAPAPARAASAPPPSPARTAASAVVPASDSPTGPPDPAQPFRGVLSPLVRKLAADHNLDLTQIQGTGSGGRITKRDVMAAVSGHGPAPAASAAAPEPAPAADAGQPAPAAPTPEAAPRDPAANLPHGGEETVQVSAMRRAIAQHMVSSITETARAWNTIEIDLTGVAGLRAKAGTAFKASEGFSLTWMPFVSKALTQTLLRFPQFNSTWNGDGTITRKHYVNLGVAVALENGLIVPVIKSAETKNLVGLARATRDLADRARSKRLTPEDVQGGTFTITNPGGFGSILSLPIINRGQAAILAFDAVVKRPVVVTDEDGGDSIAIRQMTNISISWDHRIIDGAEAAQFLAYLKQLLEEADFMTDLGGLIRG